MSDYCDPIPTDEYLTPYYKIEVSWISPAAYTLTGFDKACIAVTGIFRAILILIALLALALIASPLWIIARYGWAYWAGG